MRPPIISDTTLRDGIQMSGAHLTTAGKVLVAKALESIGIRSIEVGFPAAGEGEVHDSRAITEVLHRAVLLALCRTLPRDIDAARIIFESVPRFRCGINLFLATSPVQRERRLKMTKSEVLCRIKNCISYARQHFTRVSFSAEDASRTEPEFIDAVYRHAIDAGATAIGFPDTVGVLTPERSFEAVSRIKECIKGSETNLAVHFHNDLGLATANTLAAIRAGADVVQCTVNGLGERAGNAALEEVVIAISLNPHIYGEGLKLDTTQLPALSRLVAETTGVPIPLNKPIVGHNIFSTAAGLHQEGLLKEPETYLPFSPLLVGVSKIELVLGPHSGHAAAAAYIAATGGAPSPASVHSLIEELKATDTKLAGRSVAIDVG